MGVSIFLFGCAGLVVLPLIFLVMRSFTGDGEIWLHLVQTRLWDYLLNSITLALGAGILACLIGTFSAWLIARFRFPGCKICAWLLLLPMAIPAYVMSYAYTDLLDVAGPVQSHLRSYFAVGVQDYFFPEIRSLGGAIFVLGLVLSPYVYIFVRMALMQQNADQIDSAKLLGASWWKQFWCITRPSVLFSMAAGTTLVMMESLADFGAVSYFGVPTLTTGIYRSWFGMGSLSAASQLALLLLALVMGLVMMEKFLWQKPFHLRGSQRPPPAYQPLRKWVRWLILGCVVLIITISFFIPCLHLFLMAKDHPDHLLFSNLGQYLGNTILFASIGAVIITILGFLAAYALFLRNRPARRYAMLLGGIGYAVPGAVLAVALISMAGFFDQMIGGRIEGVALLSGSMLLLMMGYIIRFLSIGLRGGQNCFPHTRQKLDDSAALLGANSKNRLFLLHIPLGYKPMLFATILVFVEIVKELPLTLILRPFLFETLAVRVHRLASDERLAQAASGSLLIVAISLIPIILFHHYFLSPEKIRPAKEEWWSQGESNP